MPKTITQEERQLLKLVEKMPVPAEEKESWIERIRDGAMSEDLAEEIRQKLATTPEGEEAERAAANRSMYQVELAKLVRRWRLSTQSRNFGRR